jgi:hypothetical protein
MCGRLRQQVTLGKAPSELEKPGEKMQGSDPPTEWHLHSIMSNVKWMDAVANHLVSFKTADLSTLGSTFQRPAEISRERSFPNFWFKKADSSCLGITTT